MKLKLIAAAAGAAAAIAGTAGAASYTFDKVVLRHRDDDSDKLPDLNMGADWAKHVPAILKYRAWFLSKKPQKHYIQSFDGLKLAGRYLRANYRTHKILIGVHGYSSCSLYDFPGIAQLYHNHGFNVLLVDDRGHGDSEGEYAGFGVLDHKDVLKWIDYIIKEIDPKAEIYLHGISMGGASVLFAGGCELPENVRAIVADCAFTNAWEEVNYIFSNKYHMPVEPLIKLTSSICKKRAGYAFDEMNTVDSVKRIKVPVLFIHGADDTFVPVDMSKKNYEACSANKELAIFDGAQHAESFLNNPEEYEKTVFGFLDSIK